MEGVTGKRDAGESISGLSPVLGAKKPKTDHLGTYKCNNPFLIDFTRCVRGYPPFLFRF